MDREKVQNDFDELANIEGGDSGSDRYDSLLLNLIPADAKDVLEIGCGSGRFTALLAVKNRKVTALDLSREMITRARERIGHSASVSFHCGDFLELDLGEETFDCIVSAATLHHMPADRAIPKMKALLKPGGTLIIHDVRNDADLIDNARSFASFGFIAFMRLLQTGSPREPRAVREFWDRHGSNETYLTFAEAKALAERWLPGAHVFEHWLWRYTIVWKKN